MSDDPRPGPAEADLARFASALAGASPRQGAIERWLRAAFRLWCRLVGWRLECHGLTRLPRREGVPGAGCVIAAAPHRAWIEPFLLQAAWPRDGARLVWLADARTVTRSWWRRRLLPRLGIIPVTGRATPGPRAYAALASAALAAGRAIVVFPEVGPPSPPHEARRLSPGFAYLALGSGAPVVPIVLGGSHRVVRGSTFSLDVLAPVDPGMPVPDPFTTTARARAHDLAEHVATAIADTLPLRTAEADALAPERDRWTWLGRLFE